MEASTLLLRHLVAFEACGSPQATMWPYSSCSRSHGEPASADAAG